MSNLTTWTGGCHCGHVRFEVETDLAQLVSCNCSICQKRGSILAFVPAANFNLISGDSDLTDYQFGGKTIHHLFCKVCGVASFARGEKGTSGPMVAVNVRCLDGVDAGDLRPSMFDGRSL
ncbi:aldehyde-activating protein [Hyphomicrobium methylovorum]|uniref:GFA family protein n=1 Tax=Hyphomicrobium methylovorum TaxID=84 RepID=UPI0015E62FBD|nr:GFA family protein [Hyphomicrobium methylovorum]MBA2124778.1 aldehyde-activating protein [Hyphomicrobium methylovorum]